MLLGIEFAGLLTGAIAERFVRRVVAAAISAAEDGQRDLHAELAHISARLADVSN